MNRPSNCILRKHIGIPVCYSRDSGSIDRSHDLPCSFLWVFLVPTVALINTVIYVCCTILPLPDRLSINFPIIEYDIEHRTCHCKKDIRDDYRRTNLLEFPLLVMLLIPQERCLLVSYTVRTYHYHYCCY